jgi:hypothetical protein
MTPECVCPDGQGECVWCVMSAAGMLCPSCLFVVTSAGRECSACNERVGEFYLEAAV